MQDNYSFGEKLNIYRKRIGMSRKELAKRVGVSESTIARYETGKSIPSAMVYNELASVFGESLNRMLNLEDPEKGMGHNVRLWEGSEEE